MSDDDRFVFVAKMFTGARKFPRWFGRFLDGRKVPGGPYKITQIVIGGVFALVVVFTYTLHLWGTGSPVMDLIFGGGVVFGVAWASGKIPQTKRNPLSLVFSFLHAVSAPRMGRYRGKPLTPARPHSTASTRSVSAPKPAAAIPATPDQDLVQESIVPAAPAAIHPPVPATGVARLLAQATHD